MFSVLGLFFFFLKIRNVVDLSLITAGEFCFWGFLLLLSYLNLLLIICVLFCWCWVLGVVIFKAFPLLRAGLFVSLL